MKELIRFSLPLILSGVLQQLYNWADAFIVGNVDGELSLSAIGVTSIPISFFITTITGFTLGLSVLKIAEQNHAIVLHNCVVKSSMSNALKTPRHKFCRSIIARCG